jgi:GH25 family lysozyme M1 (1,4-beta-N-acetylmuramidase)
MTGCFLAAWRWRLCQAFAQSPGSDAETVEKLSEARTVGIDVAKWAGEIDWREVVSKLNPRSVFVQAYHMDKDDASSYANPRFANYRRALRRLGLLNGAYIRCHPNANAESLIKRFWSEYTPQIGDILPTLDIEEDYDSRCSLPVKDRINQIERMVQLVSTKIGGQKPMIYTKARVGSELGNPIQFSDTPLWVVDYHSTGEPTLPLPWSRFAYWQYAHDLRGNGISGTYDTDYFNGTEAGLQAYLVRKKS